MPGTFRRFAPSEWDKMISAYVGGASLKKAAALCDTHWGIVKAEVLRRGIPFRGCHDRSYRATLDG